MVALIHCAAAAILILTPTPVHASGLFSWLHHPVDENELVHQDRPRRPQAAEVLDCFYMCKKNDLQVPSGFHLGIEPRLKTLKACQAFDFNDMSTRSVDCLCLDHSTRRARIAALNKYIVEKQLVEDYEGLNFHKRKKKRDEIYRNHKSAFRDYWKRTCVAEALEDYQDFLADVALYRAEHLRMWTCCRKDSEHDEDCAAMGEWEADVGEERVCVRSSGGVSLEEGEDPSVSEHPLTVGSESLGSAVAQLEADLEATL